MTHIFSQSELDHHAAIYGANIEAWPEDVRGSACAALKSGLKIASDEVDLDAQLKAGLAVSPPSELLSRRILRAVQTETGAAISPAAANENSPRAFPKFRLAGLAAAALFAIGFVVYPAAPRLTEDEIWLEAATELGFDDVYEWVLNEDT